MGTDRHDPPSPQRAGVASDRTPVTTEQEVAHMSTNNALMATTLIEDLTRLVEQHGDLPVVMGHGHTLMTPRSPKVRNAVVDERVKTEFVCHRPLLSDLDTTPVIHLG